MLSFGNSGSIEQSTPARDASFSVMAEKVDPVSTKKLMPLLAWRAGASKKMGIIGHLLITYPMNLTLVSLLYSF
jgi:hypothetical protein